MEVDTPTLNQAIAVIRTELKKIAVDHNKEDCGFVLELHDFTVVTVMSKPEKLIHGKQHNWYEWSAAE